MCPACRPLFRGNSRRLDMSSALSLLACFQFQSIKWSKLNLQARQVCPATQEMEPAWFYLKGSSWWIFSLEHGLCIWLCFVTNNWIWICYENFEFVLKWIEFICIWMDVYAYEWMFELVHCVCILMTTSCRSGADSIEYTSGSDALVFFGFSHWL